MKKANRGNLPALLLLLMLVLAINLVSTALARRVKR